VHLRDISKTLVLRVRNDFNFTSHATRGGPPPLTLPVWLGKVRPSKLLSSALQRQGVVGGCTSQASEGGLLHYSHLTACPARGARMVCRSCVSGYVKRRNGSARRVTDGDGLCGAKVVIAYQLCLRIVDSTISRSVSTIGRPAAADRSCLSCVSLGRIVRAIEPRSVSTVGSGRRELSVLRVSRSRARAAYAAASRPGERPLGSCQSCTSLYRVSYRPAAHSCNPTWVWVTEPAHVTETVSVVQASSPTPSSVSTVGRRPTGAISPA